MSVRLEMCAVVPSSDPRHAWYQPRRKVAMRRTFCALLYEAGASPAYVMAQMGHTDASLALEVYAKVMERQRDTGERMDALLRGTPYRVVTGTETSSEIVPVAVAANEKPLFPAAS